MASWARTSVRAIVLAMRTRLVEITELDDARVTVTVLPIEDVPPFGGVQDVIVRIMGETPDEAAIDGAGRWHNLRTRSFQVGARSRVSLDEAGSDLSRMTHESLGHVLLEDLVVEALELFNAPGENDDVITAPIRVGRLTDPARMKKFDDWVWSSFTVEATYVRDLDTDLDAQFASAES